MKKINIYGMPDAAMAVGSRVLHAHVSEQEDAIAPASTQLQPSLSEVAELKQALAGSQQDLIAAKEQIEMLEKTKASLRQKLKRLALKCAKTLHFAYHDELTGLPNRSLLLDRLKQVMAQSDRKNKQVALLFIDMDKFKDVNDKLGHTAGDKLLQQVGKRLSACIRTGDTACRYGGDEFVIMLPEIEGKENAVTVTEKIRAQLTEPYELDGNVIKVTASIGVAFYRADGQNCSDLIKQADIAMYLAKTHGVFHSTF